MGSIVENVKSLEIEHVAEICRLKKKIETVEEELRNLRGELQDLKSTNENLLKDLKQSQGRRERMSHIEGFTGREQISNEANQLEAIAGTDVHDEGARLPFEVGQREADIPEQLEQESGKAGPFKTVEDVSTEADMRNEGVDKRIQTDGVGFMVGEHNENAPSPSNVFRHEATENSEEPPYQFSQQFQQASTASSGSDTSDERIQTETVKDIFTNAGDISEDADDDDMEADINTEDPQLTPGVEHYEVANTTEQTPCEFPPLAGKCVSDRPPTCALTPSMPPMERDNQGAVVSIDPAAKAELLKWAGIKRKFPAAEEQRGSEKKKQKHEAEEKPVHRKQKRQPGRRPEKLQGSTAPQQHSFGDFFQKSGANSQES